MNNDEKKRYILDNLNRSRLMQQSNNKEDQNNAWIHHAIQNTPKKLYKYRKCNEDNLDVLRKKEAWFSSPLKWEDEIDVTISMNFEQDILLIENNLDQYIEKFVSYCTSYFIDTYCLENKITNADEIKTILSDYCINQKKPNTNNIEAHLLQITSWKNVKAISSQINKLIKIVNSKEFRCKLEESLDKFLQINKIRENAIFYSLSETHSNNKQWADYADCGKGFCIGYKIEPKNDYERELIKDLLPIIYEEKETFLIMDWIMKSIEVLENEEKAKQIFNEEAQKIYTSFYTKEIVWSGEQEWRFRIDNKIDRGKAISFNFAEAIYLGDKIEKDWENKLLNIAKEQNLLVYRRKLLKNQSRWIYEKIEI